MKCCIANCFQFSEPKKENISFFKCEKVDRRKKPYFETDAKNMFCQLCLLHITEYIDIFGSEGLDLKISSIIGQHFWFEPKVGEETGNHICHPCWWKLDTFHTFYVSIKQAHENLKVTQVKDVVNESLRFPVKEETDTCLSELECAQFSQETADFDIEKSDQESCGSKGSEELTPKKGFNQTEFSNQDFQALYATITDEKNERGINTPDTAGELEQSDPNVETSTNVPKCRRPQRTKLTVHEKEGRNLRKRGCERGTNHCIETDDCLKVQTKSKRLSEESEYLKKSKENDEKIAKYMKLKCELCGLGFTTFAEVRRHYRMAHKRKGYVVCCNKKLFKRVLILDHINKHLNPEYFKCQECNRNFADKQCLKNHMVRHESEDVKVFKCDECPRRYARQYLLEQHKLTHMPEEERQYFCDECGKAFPTKNLLQTHKRYVHENVYGKMCHICAKVIKGKALFEKHQLEHAGIVEPKVQCQQCGAWLKHEYSLKKHMRRHQEELSQHVCSECGKSAPSKGALRSHIRYVHSAERIFQCSICDKSFKKALALKEHMTTHTGEVLYTCPHCPKTFNHSANMHSHRKKAHRQEWEESRKCRGMPQELLDTSTDDRFEENFNDTQVQINLSENKVESESFVCS